jgi:hypothetical protein
MASLRLGTASEHGRRLAVDVDDACVSSGTRMSLKSSAIFLSSFWVSGTKPQFSLQASLKTSITISTSRSRFFLSTGRT